MYSLTRIAQGKLGCSYSVRDDDEMQFLQWMVAGRCELNDMMESEISFVHRLEDCIPKVLQHAFTIRKQRNFIKQAKANLKDHDAHCIVQIYFSDNYTFVIQDAIQDYHWSQSQCTIHSFYVTYYDTEKHSLRHKCYGIISDSLTHSDTDAVAAYTATFLALLK